MQGEPEDLKSLLEADDAKTKIRLLAEAGLRNLYHCFYLYYKDFHTRSRFDVLRSRYVIWLAGVLVYSLQLLSLTYPPDISNWTSFRWWVYFSSLARLDFVLVVLNLGAIGFYVMLGLVLLPVGLFACFLIGRRSKGDGRMFYLICMSSKILKTFLHLPGLCLFFSVFKYTLSPSTTSFEYISSDVSQLNIPIIGHASLVFVAVLTVWVFVETSLDYDMYYTRRQAVVTARAHSKIEVATLLGVTCVSASHFFLHEANSIVHLSLCMVTGIGSVLLYLIYLPFYNQFTNFIYGMCYFVLGWGGLVQLLGMALNSCTTSFILTVSIPFVFAYIYWDLLDRRTKSIQLTYIGKFVLLPSPYLAELAVRFVAFEYILQKQAKKPNPKLKETMRDLYLRMTGKFDRSKFAALCEFLYVYSILNHEGLARLKLSKARNCAFDFEADYNLYRFSMLLEENSKQNFEEVHYVRFRDLYDTAKKADEDACVLQMEFWSELSMEVPVVKTIESMGMRLFFSIHRARKLSKRLLKKFPQNHLALKLFGTFLLEVYNDTEKGQELLSRGLYEEKQQGSKPQGASERFSYFDDNNGIMLVSGNVEAVGTISYINSQACLLLGVPQRLALAMNIVSFLPGYAVDLRKHSKAMLRFLATCSSYEVSIPKSLFLIDNTGFLIEVFIQVRCMVLDQDPFFIVVMKGATYSREMAIYDEDYTVQGHSKGFPMLVGFADDMSSMKGCSLRQAFTNFEEMKNGHPGEDVFTYRIPNTVNEIFLRFVEIKIVTTVIFALHATASSEEAQSWKDGEALNFEDMLNLPAIPTAEPTEEQEALNTTGKRGILRDPKAPKKHSHITFNLNPEVREIEMTDFAAGKQIIGKVKDAAPLKKDAEKEASKVEEVKDDAKAKVSFDEKVEEAEIMDLKDLAEFASPVGASSTPADQMSRISEMIAPSEASDNRKNGTSVASSAVSANASFTSSAKAQELLKSVNSSMLRFKVSFVLTHVVVVAAVLSMMLYLYFITQRYLVVINITDLSNERIQLTDLAEEARYFEMVASGILPASYEDQLKTEMNQSANNMGAIRDRLAGQVSSWEDGEHKSLYFDDKVMTWELSNGKIIYTFRNLLNFMDAIVVHAESLILANTHDRNCTNSDLFFLYRNAYGVGARLMNESLVWFIQGESDNLSSTMNIILVLGGIAVALLAVFFTAVIFPTVLAVERSNQNVWTFFYGLPLDIVQEMIFRCEERLENTHGIEVDKKDTQRGKFKNMDSREKIKCTRKWPIIVTRMWLYYALTCAYFLFFYYQGYSAFDSLLREKPIVENLAGQRVLSLDGGFFWLQETLLEATSKCSYLQSLPEFQYTPSPPLTAASFLEVMRYSEFELAQGLYQGFGVTPSHEQLLFQDGCVGMGANCSDSLLVRGLHSSLSVFNQDIGYELSAKETLVPTQTTILTKQLMYEIGQTLQSAYQSEVESQLNEMLKLIIGITVLYIILSVLFYFILYIPMANNVRRQITETWELARLIPIDLLERILKALKKNTTAKKR